MKFKIDEHDASVIVDTLPGCLGDITQLTQLFTNLLDNAIKYLQPHRKGIINITGWTEDEMSIYCIEDNGIGIAPEYREEIFDIFYRVAPEGHVPGEGMGLSIVQRILELNNGEIRLESKPGKGSRFFVSLPTAPN